MTNNILNKLFFKKEYFSQTGEDIICDFWIRKNKGFYIEIGSNEPVKLNNTYLFYKKGWNGICIEPNPELASQISKVRPRDKVLNIGISSSNSPMPFYLIEPNTLSTFSVKDRDLFLKAGYKLRKETLVTCHKLKDVLEKYNVKKVDLMSVDTEGTELDILKSNNWIKYRPSMIIVETVSHKPIVKDIEEINNYLKRRGYFLFADTFINSIFASKEWLEEKGIKL